MKIRPIFSKPSPISKNSKEGPAAAAGFTLIEVMMATAILSLGLVMIYQGWWHKSGAVNFLTAERLSDMGEQAAYYDTFCRIEPEHLSAD